MDKQHHSQLFTCPACKEQYAISSLNRPLFCPFCNTSLPVSEEKAPSSIIGGRYQVIKSIGKGGMGEVLLAYDASCERKIALKRIRPDLLDHPQLHHRFLKEARITCQLIHPAIVPIYTIHHDPSTTYYTMPFVEGETLKQIIKKTRLQEKKGEELNHIGGSIPALMRIFITICQAVAYAHSKGVLHRDLKLENIIIGKYGEVLLLDWGLAKWIRDRPEEDLNLIPKLFEVKEDITRMGKVVGTIAYMAPERAIGQPATIQTDVYSLGVILYQMLTLRPPFKRGKTLEEFRKAIAKEEYVDPIVLAPYRDVPHLLAKITQKCLSLDLNERYAKVDNLIYDIESYIEGRSDWFHISNLNIKEKSDWEFQENVLIAEQMAITRVMEDANWVSLMISRQSFSGNTKIETTVCIRENGHGIGFLLSVPEAPERIHFFEGYCLCLGSDLTRSTKLSRSNVEVMSAPDIFLKRDQSYRIRIEKIEQSIHLYIDDVLQFSYITHLPQMGTHIGLVARDADFDIEPLQVYVGSLNIMVNCLAVPDAFLAHQDFNQALNEYRRIAYSFPDRVEGREAIFRAGLTLLEQGKRSLKKDQIFDEALQEFEKLHHTPGAPLEYLGKAIVYQTLHDSAEEIKCFELAYRRYPGHPLLSVLQEQILSRMHQVARHNRIAAYEFILLTVRHFSRESIDTHTKRLFNSLQKHWEYLPFIEEDPAKDKAMHPYHFAIQVAFWLAKPYVLGEIIDELSSITPLSTIEIENALFCIIELGSWQYARTKLSQLENFTCPELEIALQCHEKPLEEIVFPTEINFKSWRTIMFFFNRALDVQDYALIHERSHQIANLKITDDQKLELDAVNIAAYLFEKNWKGAQALLENYPEDILNKESTLIHFLHGCWLRATEGEEISRIHFAGVLNVPYPRSWSLGSHFITGDFSLDGLWFSRAFLWEKRQLYRQLNLYYHCADNQAKQKEFQQLYHQEFIHADA